MLHLPAKVLHIFLNRFLKIILRGFVTKENYDKYERKSYKNQLVITTSWLAKEKKINFDTL